ncbi:MAG: cupin domain-containing protein [Lachnoclostridium sp.]|jgi:mannose-6-phosphate isomerase-like protein (cupin superfamily)|nr:cupin domain-containing protein [Lachnoclostridium sp.]
MYNYDIYNTGRRISASSEPITQQDDSSYFPGKITDYGPDPFVVDITKSTLHNETYRTALWTGKYLQLTLMSIPVGEDVGLEIHPDNDQFFRVEDGQGLVQMGDREDNLYYQQPAYDDNAIFIPAGTWHNITNTGKKPLKLYSIYAPPHHPYGTIQQTKAIAEAEEAKEQNTTKEIDTMSKSDEFDEG